MQKYCTDGKADVAPKRKEAREVIFVKVIDTPTLYITRIIGLTIK